MGDSTMARFLAASMTSDLIISCMAISAGTLKLLSSRPGKKPAIIEWMPPTKPGHHPDWRAPAWNLRDATGRLIPNLLRRFPVTGGAMPERIAVIGFSAGSNSGVRELIRNEQDREAISFVGSIDGLHFQLDSERKVLSMADYTPWVQYALRAARGDAMMVITGNNLEAPTKTTTRTPEGMRMINRSLLSALNEVDDVEQYPTDGELIQQFTAMGPPIPNGLGGIGSCYFFEYPGTQREDHIIQARIIVPRVMDTFLAAAWGEADWNQPAV